MNEQSFENGIRRFYEGERLDDQHLDLMIEAVTYADSVRRWKLTTLAVSVALAATILVAVGVLISSQNGVPMNYSAKERQATSPIGSVVTELEPRTSDNPATIVSSQNNTNQYRLVAIRSHGDGCPHCMETERVFQQLQTAFAKLPITLEKIDLSQADDLANTNDRLNELKLSNLVAGRNETAFLAFMDGNGRQLREYKPSQKSENIAKSIRELMK